jgi:hypothetical protein
MISKSAILAAAIGGLSVVTSISAAAETDLTGKWAGQFNGVQIEIPLQSTTMDYLSGKPTGTVQGPRFVEARLQMEFETQKNGLAVGNWIAGKFKQQFVCAQISTAVWNCVDSGGRASLEVTSETEIKVCYLDSREGAQGAGCAVLRKAK